MKRKHDLIPQVDKFRSQGLTVAQACEKAGLSVPTYYAYHRPEKKAGKAGRPAKTGRSPEWNGDSVVLLVIPGAQAKKLIRKISSVLR